MSAIGDKDGKKAFFAAANTGDGFVSMFEELFFGGNIKKRYIIKGGPGTGKSSLMRRVGAFAESRGAEVEYYYCSSDTDSIDGLIINGEIAIFDGTSPHSYDTAEPGYVDSLVDLGRFWRAEMLEKNAEALRSLSEQKREAYGRAYGYLAAAMRTGRIADDLTRRCVLLSKLRSAARREISKLDLRGKGNVIIRQTTSMGVGGARYLPTLCDMAAEVHFIDDMGGISSIYLEELRKLARERGYSAIVSYDTLDRRRIREMLFTESGDLFTSCQDCAERAGARINMRRFVDAARFADIRRQYRETVGCEERLIGLASEELERAGRAHAALEGYYVSAMDFSSLEKYCAEFIDKLPPL